MKTKTLLGVVVGLAVATTAALAADITGAGSTFVFPVLAKWSASYKGISGNGINYQSIGSGGGIAQVKAKTVTFGATDAPLKAEQLEKDGL
ncbi:MAG TPA: substrate-binding domain-containing protein, partial [Rhizomicrobium sp.]|nr:substrate-binding domain-containing protein [Rhizomicrobium sp.]